MSHVDLNDETLHSPLLTALVKQLGQDALGHPERQDADLARREQAYADLQRMLGVELFRKSERLDRVIFYLDQHGGRRDHTRYYRLDQRVIVITEPYALERGAEHREDVIRSFDPLKAEGWSVDVSSLSIHYPGRTLMIMLTSPYNFLQTLR